MNFEGCLIYLSHCCWYFLFYFQLNYCYTWVGHQANVICESGPVLLSLLFLAHNSCYISAEIWLLVAGMCGYLACFSLSCEARLLRDDVLCAGQILCFGVLSAVCHSLGFSSWSCYFTLILTTVFYIWIVIAGSLCLNGWICPCYALFKIQWVADPAVLITPESKMVFISCEGQWFVVEHVLFEMSQLSKGISKVLLQLLLVTDENGIFSLSKVFFLLLKCTNWRTFRFDIQILVIFSKGKIK